MFRALALRLALAYMLVAQGLLGGFASGAAAAPLMGEAGWPPALCLGATQGPPADPDGKPLPPHDNRCCLAGCINGHAPALAQRGAAPLPLPEASLTRHTRPAAETQAHPRPPAAAFHPRAPPSAS
ncbi:hypothetical protein ACT6QH_10370 [Xanthobacter sp. TB0139]|uniref:hypothetical protein n=1 Tax=Xanthobacter sp. TB0139 TaxID=3459178 RepID=UPI004039A4DD